MIEVIFYNACCIALFGLLQGTPIGHMLAFLWIPAIPVIFSQSLPSVCISRSVLCFPYSVSYPDSDPLFSFSFAFIRVTQRVRHDWATFPFILPYIYKSCTSFVKLKVKVSHVQLFVTPWMLESMDQLSHQGSSKIVKWVVYPFSSRSSWPRNQIGVSCIAGRFFTSWTTREAPLLN